MLTNDYRESAKHYALRGISGTDSLAFREVAERVRVLRLSGKALDLGCGSGRSTRFLKALGFQTIGVDVSESMVAQARQLDPDGTYLTYSPGDRLPLDEASFDVIFSSWVVLELGSREYLRRYFREAARVLESGGKGFIVTNTAEFYRHRWVSCEVDFPENQAPLRSGQPVKARLIPEGVTVTDVFWSDRDYREAMAASGLTVAHALYPKASPSEPHWLDETRIAPWVVYELDKTR